MEPIVIIPALNPDQKLLLLAEYLHKFGMKIVVVNDGSKASCQYIFDKLQEEYQCDLCVHEINIGKGAALKTGIRYASSHYPDNCGYITADADGQHAPMDILRVGKMLKMHPSELILGKREFSGGDVPFKSAWGNRITSFVYLLSTGKRCADTQTGLRGIPNRYTRLCMEIPGDQYEYEMNMLLEMGRQKIDFIYVPISTIYIEDNRSSHFHPLRDSAKIYWSILKYSLSSMASAAVDLSLFAFMIHFLFGAANGGILAATVLARLISGSVNFLINRNWVFTSKKSYHSEVIHYIILFLSQMLLSWLLVSSLKGLPINLNLLKMSVDTGLFFISYFIQKNHIFRNKQKGVDESNEKFLYKTL